MSRRGRRDVEEGNVREGFRGLDLGISRLSKGPWTWGTGGSSLKGSNRQWVRTYASGIGERPKHRRSGDQGLWVRNKEQWADRRAMTANTRVRGPRRVSRSSSIRRPLYSNTTASYTRASVLTSANRYGILTTEDVKYGMMTLFNNKREGRSDR